MTNDLTWTRFEFRVFSDVLDFILTTVLSVLV